MFNKKIYDKIDKFYILTSGKVCQIKKLIYLIEDMVKQIINYRKKSKNEKK